MENHLGFLYFIPLPVSFFCYESSNQLQSIDNTRNLPGK